MARVAGGTAPRPLNTLDTVFLDSPQASAMSCMVTRLFAMLHTAFLIAVFIIAPKEQHSKFTKCKQYAFPKGSKLPNACLIRQSNSQKTQIFSLDIDNI
jgi:hypothetical protein